MNKYSEDKNEKKEILYCQDDGVFSMCLACGKNEVQTWVKLKAIHV